MDISINSSLSNDTRESSSASSDDIEEAFSRVLMEVESTFAVEDSRTKGCRRQEERCFG